jgi:hypothetical protein
MSKKELKQDEGNRVADGAKVFDPADDSHVERVTPIQTKRKELMDDSRYSTEAAPDTNKARERRTTVLRKDKETRPL